MRLCLFLLLFAVSGSALRAQQPPASGAQAQALFVEALLHAFLEDHDAAIPRYREVLEEVPGQPAVLSALAESYAATGQSALAQQTADAAVAGDPQNPHFAVAAARLAAAAGDLSGAVARYEALLAHHPDEPQALDALAALYERRGAYAEAAALLERLPATTDVLARLLGLYARLDDDVAWLRLSEQLAASADASLLYQFGLHHLAHGRPEAARIAFEEVLRRDPGHRAAREALSGLGAAVPETTPSPGMAAYATGDFARAAQLLQSSLDADPRDPDGWARAAMAHLEAGQLPEAERLIGDGRLIFFDYPPLLVAAIYHALASGNRGAAEALITEALSAVDVAEATPAHRAAVALAAAYAHRTEVPAALQAEVGALRAQALAPAAAGALAAKLGNR